MILFRPIRVGPAMVAGRLARSATLEYVGNAEGAPGAALGGLYAEVGALAELGYDPETGALHGVTLDRPAFVVVQAGAGDPPPPAAPDLRALSWDPANARLLAVDRPIEWNPRPAPGTRRSPSSRRPTPARPR